ncbi:HEAT repeat domain-containing protein [Candidatus Woesearchaeota archaeon]|nr:HEAT repeat domain-containing protein [Candidatus Woesearchaeota archaeon]
MVDYKEIILDLKRTKEERIQAAFNLENLADEASIHVLAQALETDPSPIVRHECAFALGETSCPRLATGPLKQACEKDPSIFVRHEALLALATLGDKNNLFFIQRFLKDKDPEIVESAEIAIQRLKNS